MTTRAEIAAILQEHLAPRLADETAVEIEKVLLRRANVEAVKRNDLVPTHVEPLDFAAAAVLLHQYSEWLDGRSFGGMMTHDDLVDQFLASRSPEARPIVEVRS